MKIGFFVAAVGLALSACATAKSGTGSETSIPFVSSDGIVEWRVAADDALYIKAMGGEWYYVRTMVSCTHLRSAVALGFATSALGQLDRHGAIIAEGQRCPVASVIKSAAPPEHTGS